MRRVVVLLVAFQTAFTASGSDIHTATPADVLRKLLPQMTHDEWIDGAEGSAHDEICPEPDVSTEAARTFALNAHRFDYGVTPSPFVVELGDTVTLNITATDVSHGFFLERYAPSSHFIASGTTITIGPFVADQAGTFTFFCTNPCGTGHGGMDGVFTVAGPSGQPMITSFSPTNGPVSGGNDVNVFGSGFQSGATASFGASAAPVVTVNSSTSLTAIAPAHPAGSVAITVTNPGGLSASRDGYVYVEGPPSISSFSPASGPVSGGNEVAISGSGFRDGATVLFGSFPSLGVTFVDSAKLRALAPAHAAGPVTITVTNPDGQSASRGSYTYVAAAAPTVTSVSPVRGTTRGGTSVTITGSGFDQSGSVTVTLGGAAATRIVVVDAATITATTPPHAAGNVDVVVTVGAQSATLSSGFAYVFRLRPARR